MRRKLSIFILFFLTFISCQEQKQTDAKVSTNLDVYPSTPQGVCPIKEGSVLDSGIKVKNVKGEIVDLKAVTLGTKAVIIFYRGGWCPYCSKQLQNLRKIEGELKSLGYQVIGISPDKPEKLADSIKKNEIGYTLYSDSNFEAIKSFGLAYKVSNEMNQKLEGHKIFLSEYSGKEEKVLPVPGVFIIDENSMIQFSYTNPNYKVRLNEKIILNLAKSI